MSWFKAPKIIVFSNKSRDSRRWWLNSISHVLEKFKNARRRIWKRVWFGNKRINFYV